MLGHDLVKGWGWLDPFANFFGAIVGGFNKLPGTHPLKDLLHGTWPLHHPLHPAVTDLTIGGDTATVPLGEPYIATGEPRVPPPPDFLLSLSFLTPPPPTLPGVHHLNTTINNHHP